MSIITVCKVITDLESIYRLSLKPRKTLILAKLSFCLFNLELSPLDINDSACILHMHIYTLVLSFARFSASVNSPILCCCSPMNYRFLSFLSAALYILKCIGYVWLVFQISFFVLFSLWHLCPTDFIFFFPGYATSISQKPFSRCLLLELSKMLNVHFCPIVFSFIFRSVAYFVFVIFSFKWH